MEIETLQKITDVLFLRFSLQFNADIRIIDGFTEVNLSPEFSDMSEGFKIIVHVGWKKLSCKFLPGPKAGLLLISMGNASLKDKNVFVSVAENITSMNGNVHLLVNNLKQDPLKYETWPSHWSTLSLSMTSPFVETESDLSEEGQLDELIVQWTGLFISMIFPLLPVVTVGVKESEEFMGEFEGSKSRSVSTIYERSRKNRQACLAANGYRCKVCNLVYEEVYGPIGAGYIEVHHITPVSSLGDDYLINPVKDLVPLCANCHAMIHRKDPSYSVSELLTIYSSNNKNY